MTSPYYIHTSSSKQVIRILKLITHKLLSWSNTKFSQIFYKGMCSNYREELTITSWELKGWGFFICHTNNMISSAIWCCQAWVKFSKKTKLNKSIGQVQLIVFENFSKSLLFQIAREIMSLLIMYMKKHQSQDIQNFESIHVLFVICTLVSQSESHNFFMYILTKIKTTYNYNIQRFI